MTFKQLALPILSALAVLAGLPAAYLYTLDANQYRDLLVDGVEQATGHRLAIDGALELAVSLTPELSATGVRLVNPAWDEGRPWLTAERIEGRVGLLALLGGTVEVRNFALVRPVLDLETDAGGRRNWARLHAPGPGTRAGSVDFRVDEVSLDGLTFAYRDGASGTEHTAQIASLKLSKASETRLKVTAEGRYGSHAIRAHGQIGRLRALARGLPYPIVAAIESDGARISVDGMLETAIASPTFVGAISATVKDVGALNEGVARHVAPDTSLDLNGSLTASPRHLALEELTLALAGSTASGELALALEGERPRLTGNVSIDRLDLDALRGDAGRAKRRTRAGRVFSSTPLALAPLEAGDARLDVRVGELAWDGATLRDVTTTLALEDGRLDANPIRAGLAGSRASGSVSFDASGRLPALAVKLSASRVPVRSLMRRIGSRDRLEGLADIQLDATSRGNDVATLMGNLDGNARLLMDNGRIRARRVEKIVAGLGGLFAPKGAGDDDWTELSCAAADLEIAGGVVTPNVLVVDTERATVFGEGNVDLGEETIALKLTPYPKTFTLNVAVPMWMRGTLAEPAYALDEFAVVRRVGVIALMAFPPTAVASLGTLALASAATLGMGGAAAHDSDHPCLRLIDTGTRKARGSGTRSKPQRLARDEPDSRHAFATQGLVPRATVGAVEH